MKYDLVLTGKFKKGLKLASFYLNSLIMQNHGLVPEGTSCGFVGRKVKMNISQDLIAIISIVKDNRNNTRSIYI